MAVPDRAFSQEDKLRIWQGLCYEVSIPPSSKPSLEVAEVMQLGLADIKEEDSDSDSDSDSEDSDESSTDSAEFIRPMPQSLTAARNLLKAEGHVNIRDYFDARKLGKVGAGRYAHLVHPTAGSMIRYTIANKRFVKLAIAKGEALEPLLRFFSRSRKAFDN